MKYALALAAAGLAVAAPGNEWESWSSSTTTASTTTAEWNTWSTTTASTTSAEWNTWTTTTPSSSGWNTWTTTTPSSYEWNTWSSSSYKKECPYTTTYTTTECGEKTTAWDNCKVATKTETKYPETCTGTWSEWSTYPASTATTWATYSMKTPEAASSTWNTWKASGSVSAPVAKWTGAADRQTVGAGALAIAAIAALL